MIAILAGFILFSSVGWLYSAHELRVSPGDLTPNRPALVLFGNSRIAAAVDSATLERRLSSDSQPVRVRVFTGGGWNALQYLMLAQENSRVLRPGCDAVAIEISPLSVDDNQSDNRIDAIRPRTALALIGAPSVPLGTRLHLLVNVLSPLFRYHEAIQTRLVQARLERIASAISSRIPVHDAKAAAIQPAYRVVTMPDKDYVIQSIEGDRAAFLAAARRKTARDVSDMHFGGYFFWALSSAVQTLRSRGLAVYLIQTPVTSHLRAELDSSESAVLYRRSVSELAEKTGARIIWNWPDQLSDSTAFADDMHMLGDKGGTRFSRFLGDSLEASRWPSCGPAH